MKKVIVLIMLLVLSLLLCACKERTVQAYAIFDDDLTQLQEQQIVAEINRLAGVHASEYVTAEDTLESLIETYGDHEIFDGVDVDSLHGHVIVTVSSADADDVLDEIEDIDGVDEATELPKTTLLVRFGLWLYDKVQ